MSEHHGRMTCEWMDQHYVALQKQLEEAEQQLAQAREENAELTRDNNWKREKASADLKTIQHYEASLGTALRLLALVQKRHDSLFSHDAETMQLVVEIAEFLRDYPYQKTSDLAAENAQARALLEKIAPIRGRYASEAFSIVQDEIRAFLAEHPKEPQP